MITISKISGTPFRILLATTLIVGHFAICACPASAEVVVIESVNSCCAHEEASDPQSCCGDEECASTASGDAENDAVAVPTGSETVSVAASNETPSRDNVSPESPTNAFPVHLQVPTHTVPAQLLFCALTQ